VANNALQAIISEIAPTEIWGCELDVQRLSLSGWWC